MYSPAARQTEARFDQALTARFGYDPLGKDGHYQWCTNMLTRQSVIHALDNPPQDA